MAFELPPAFDLSGTRISVADAREHFRPSDAHGYAELLNERRARLGRLGRALAELELGWCQHERGPGHEGDRVPVQGFGEDRAKKIWQLLTVELW